MWITVAAALAVCAVVGAALTVNAAGGAASNLGVEMRTKDDIAIFARSHPADLDAVAEYSTAPSFSEPYAPGKMTASSTQSALDTLNLMRYIAGLSADITISPAKTEYAEAAAFVNSLNDKMDHYPVRPSQLSDQKYDELYSMGADGASKSDLVSGWRSTQKINLNNLIPHSWFADNDSSNISRVGHRRWLLNPFMKTVGFGLSSRTGEYNGHQGYSFFGAAFVQDEPGSNSNEESFFKDWGGMTVAWPAQVMPVEYFDSSYPWSLSVGYKFDYDNTTVKLVRKSDNKTWQFSQSASDGEFYCDSTAENYGSPAVVVFKPSDLQIKAGDIFEVTVNIAENSNTVKTVSYNVEFFSLTDYVVSDPSETTAPKPAETTPETGEKTGLKIDAEHFPDDTFRTYISDNFDTDKDGVLSEEEIADVTAIDVGQMWTISSLKGIEYFAKLTELDASSNNLAELDVTHNAKLTHLNVSGNYLTELDVSKNPNLENLNCSWNNLEKLDVSKNAALTYLDCNYNELTSLELTASLKTLYLESNHLTEFTVPDGFELDVDGAYMYFQTALKPVTITKTAEGKYRVDMSGFVDDVSKIEYIYSTVTDEAGNKTSDGIFEFADDPLSIEYYYAVCDTARLRVAVDTDMDESGAEYLPIDEEHFPDANFRKYLKSLDFVSNPERGFTPRELNKVSEISCDFLDIKDFEGIELFPNLTSFSLFGNPLESLVMPECEKLNAVSVNYCDLKSLDVSKLKNLTYLNCSNNKLTALDVSNNEYLFDLHCDNNKLTELDFSNNSYLRAFTCDGNNIAYIDISGTDIVEFAQEYEGYFSAGSQTLDKKITVTDKNGTYTLKLADVIGDADISDVTVTVTNGTVKDGIITFTEKPTSLEYKIVYGTDVADNELAMTVTASNIEIKTAETNPPVTEPDPPVTELVDKDDDVTVQYPESDAAYYEDVKLVVEPKESVANDRVSYSIELIKNGKPIQPKSTITIKLPVPKGWDVSTIVVYHVDDNGNREKILSSISSDGKYVVFTTDHLSIYELATESSAPAETTSAPAETTAAPAETTAAPVETTAAPAETTAKPAETTAAPAETTAAPAETTAAPAETTAAPAETTAAPAETTAAPVVTTATPSTGSTAQPPETGDGVGVASALIVTVMCVGAAGIAVFTCSKKRR